jgi:hypothetical protein
MRIKDPGTSPTNGEGREREVKKMSFYAARAHEEA